MSIAGVINWGCLRDARSLAELVLLEKVWYIKRVGDRSRGHATVNLACRAWREDYESQSLTQSIALVPRVGNKRGSYLIIGLAVLLAERGEKAVALMFGARRKYRRGAGFPTTIRGAPTTSLRRFDALGAWRRGHSPGCVRKGVPCHREFGRWW